MIIDTSTEKTANNHNAPGNIKKRWAITLGLSNFPELNKKQSSGSNTTQTTTTKMVHSNSISYSAVSNNSKDISDIKSNLNSELTTLKDKLKEEVREYTKDANSKALSKFKNKMTQFFENHMMVIFNVQMTLMRQEIAKAFQMMQQSGSLHLIQIRVYTQPGSTNLKMDIKICTGNQ